jgi:hypothetical protein
MVGSPILRAVHKALLDLERALGIDAPVTIEVKRIMEGLAELHLIEDPGGADVLFPL